MIQSSLLQWFRKKGRDLPWRKTRDPYAIWISEIMLQQTQVKTVIPYYEKWMKKFPTVRKLSNAPLSRVLKLWEGLGYYSRARNLHQTAKMVDNKLGGKFPDSRKELEFLPGIGRYTAGAIASIAFNKREPILDGNVMRVLSRLYAFKKPIDQTDGRNELWEISRKLVEACPERFVGDFNQSLMELGALVCLPENPRCAICPVENDCAAHRLKKENDFPIKSRRQKLEKLHTVAAVIWNKGRVLLQRQPLRARWGGLWMFPQWIHRNGKTETEFLQERVREDLGFEIEKARSKLQIKHGFTKYQVRLRVYEGMKPYRKGRLRTCPSTEAGTCKRRPYMRWFTPQKFSHLALPSPHQKIARAIQAHA